MFLCRKKGMTLLEMMIAISIFVVLFAVLHQFVKISNDSWSDAESNMRMREQARFGIDTIYDELRAAIGEYTRIISSPAAGRTISGTASNGVAFSFTIPNDIDTSSHALAFRLPAPAQDGTVLQDNIADNEIINPGHWILYYVNTQHNFVRDDRESSNNGTSEPKVVARYVSNLKISGEATNPVSVDISLNFNNSTFMGLSRRMVLYGNSSSKRGAGAMISLRNAPASSPESDSSQDVDNDDDDGGNNNNGNGQDNTSTYFSL